MTVTALDHFTIAAGDLDRTVAFYESVLGLARGPRPDFDFPGAWLYAGGRPVVHLFVADAPNDASTGALDHIAFRAEGLAATLDRLEELGIAYRRQSVPGTKLHQLFLHDPDGLRIELNFAEE